MKRGSEGGRMGRGRRRRERGECGKKGSVSIAVGARKDEPEIYRKGR